MATMYFNNSNPGIPQLSYTYGTLTTMLDWALVQNGWTILFSSGHRRVYKMPGGSQRCLQVVHDNSVNSSNPGFASLRGCQTATDVNTLVEPFPTPAQLSNDNSAIIVSGGTPSYNRPFRLIVGTTFLLLACHANDLSATSGWEFTWFGDAVPTDPADTFATCITVRVGGTALSSSISGGVLGLKTFWIRSIDGNVLSTRGCFQGLSSSPSTSTSIGSVSNAPGARYGYLNRVVREPMAASCTGSPSGTVGPLAIIRRGWLPNLWNPIHASIGGNDSNDTFTDSQYAVGSLFSFIVAGSGQWAIIEHSDTWHLP